MFVIIFVTFLSVVGVLLWRRYARMVYLASKLPGPPALPIIGNGLMFINKKPSEMMLGITESIEKYRGVTRFWLGTHLLIYLSDPKAIEVLVSSNTLIEKSLEYHTMKPWLNDGLLMSKGKKWHKRRKIITPTFHFKILEQFVDIFNRQSNTLLETLSKFKPTDKVELYPIITLFALDVICETSMGTCVNAQIKTDSEYVVAIQEIAHVLHLRMFDFLLAIDFFFNLSKYAKIQERALKTLHSFTDKVIQQRRLGLVESGTNDTPDDEQNDIGAKRKLAFLDMLLQSTIDGEPLSDLDIREEVDTFMFEGHDTTTSGITFTLYNIAKYSNVQQKCYEEIMEICGNDPKKLMTLTDLNNLSYLEKVIKESMRIYPPVPLIARHIREDTGINGKVYPAGCSLGISIFSMGRDPNLFPNPETFIPERFDNDAHSEKSHTFAYLPFSAGARNCIGQKFAILEMKSVIGKILRKFHLSLDADSEQEPIIMAELVLKPESKINFHISARV